MHLCLISAYRRQPDIRRDTTLDDLGQIPRAHRHGRTRDGCARRRATFQTSPHSSQRQYACSSGLRAVVEIERD
jgi:hypothetical protein